jgi:hypothetical protein
LIPNPLRPAAARVWFAADQEITSQVAVVLRLNMNAGEVEDAEKKWRQPVQKKDLRLADTILPEKNRAMHI